ncbi:hypothetical protein [Deinococcus gobiensis]|uniref:Transmembrane protein n=1 Tax=Deinococcus gobiensis (strain DSM 21396 / JCM 16679 / CGMCC 1.7299 / I-0) TaxID=745776 RepID=H8H337_DEIGI|nr:hypothetical protein [Deinococcus gobiensis]AFD27934.1 hypothetical protein DGo_PC0142 [Deinococcus gobiensis I-0]
MNTTKQSTRDRQWTRTRQAELAYQVVFSAVFLIGIYFRPSSAVFWLFSAAVMLGGFAIWIWQYRALDELGKARFAFSWMVSGMVFSSGVALVLMWAIYDALKRDHTLENVPSLPFWPMYIVLCVGLLTMWLTNLYLRGRDGRGG